MKTLTPILTFAGWLLTIFALLGGSFGMSGYEFNFRGVDLTIDHWYYSLGLILLGLCMVFLPKILQKNRKPE